MLDKPTHEMVLRFCRLRDSLGVISVYVGATPEKRGAPSQWQVSIRNQIRGLQQRVREEGPRERWVAVSERLEGLREDIDRLCDPKESGRGRALFAPVSSDEVHRIAVQLEFPDAVILEETAYVRPLVVALDEGRPAGIVAVDRTGIRLLEWGFGEVEELERHSFDEEGLDWRQMKGPAPRQPQVHQHGADHKELFEQRLEDNRLRFLRQTASRLQKDIAGRGWDRVVVAGEPKYGKPVSEELVKGNDLEVLRTEHDFHHAKPQDVAAAVLPLLSDAQEAREADLVERARELALSGRQGALGIADALTALAEARVAHLLYDDRREFHGLRGPDGQLYAEHNAPDAPDLAPEPHLAERMVERGLETSAVVIPVRGRAAELLEPHEGVAALLRW